MKKRVLIAGLSLAAVLIVVTVLFFLPTRDALQRPFLLNERLHHMPAENMEAVSFDDEFIKVY